MLPFFHLLTKDWQEDGRVGAGLHPLLDGVRKASVRAHPKPDAQTRCAPKPQHCHRVSGLPRCLGHGNAQTVPEVFKPFIFT